MAIQNFAKFFPPGRGLLDGNHLNKIFTGQEAVKAIVIQSGGSFTSNAGFTVNGQQKQNLATVIATGNAVTNARTVGATASLVAVNATASTEGVKLPPHPPASRSPSWRRPPSRCWSTHLPPVSRSARVRPTRPRSRSPLTPARFSSRSARPSGACLKLDGFG